MGVELAATIREYRKRHGLNQAQLANLAEVSSITVHRLEAGSATVQLDKLTRVLNTLGLELIIQPRLNSSQKSPS